MKVVTFPTVALLAMVAVGCRDRSAGGRPDVSPTPSASMRVEEHGLDIARLPVIAQEWDESPRVVQGGEALRFLLLSKGNVTACLAKGDTPELRCATRDRSHPTYFLLPGDPGAPLVVAARSVVYEESTTLNLDSGKRYPAYVVGFVRTDGTVAGAAPTAQDEPTWLVATTSAVLSRTPVARGVDSVFRNHVLAIDRRPKSSSRVRRRDVGKDGSLVGKWIDAGEIPSATAFAESVCTKGDQTVVIWGNSYPLYVSFGGPSRGWRTPASPGRNGVRISWLCG